MFIQNHCTFAAGINLMQRRLQDISSIPRAIHDSMTWTSHDIILCLMCFPAYGNFLISTSHFKLVAPFVKRSCLTQPTVTRYEAFGHRCMVQLGMDGLLDLAIVVASFQGRFSGAAEMGSLGFDMSNG